VLEKLPDRHDRDSVVGRAFAGLQGDDQPLLQRRLSRLGRADVGAGVAICGLPVALLVTAVRNTAALYREETRPRD